MVNKALILAAGYGSRLRNHKNQTPKPLRIVSGLTLIKRTILSCQKAGLKECFIVVGYEKERIIKEVSSYNLDIKITFIENTEWQKSNGVSVMVAKDYLKENFIILMSDHIFNHETLKKLKDKKLESNRVLLTIDKRLNKIFDIDDATKVVVENGQIKEIGKELKNFNAVDTGIFLASPDLILKLEEVYAQKNDCSLSEGLKLLANDNKFGTFDIGDGFWQDVDTPQAKKHAEKVLLKACRKTTDGFVSRYFNRYISLFISRFLVKTPLTANQVTALISPIGILSGYLVAFGDYKNVVVGAILFKLSSILDGVDGEISKLKLSSSKLGQWLDTLSDNLTYVCFIVGMVIGLARIEASNIAITGTATLCGLFLCLFIMFFYLTKKTDSGSLLAIQEEFHREKNVGLLQKILRKVQFMLKRDFFASLFLILALFDQLYAILILCMIGTNVAWMAILKSTLSIAKEPSMALEVHKK